MYDHTCIINFHTKSLQPINNTNAMKSNDENSCEKRISHRSFHFKRASLTTGVILTHCTRL